MPISHHVAGSGYVKLECLDRSLPLLLDSRSMVSLICQSYFDQYIKLALGPANGPEAFADNLFELKNVNDSEIPLTRYFEIDTGFLDWKFPKLISYS